MLEITSEIDPRLSAVQTYLLKVNAMIALRSGHGLLSIWLATLDAHESNSNVQLIQNLDARVRQLPTGSDSDRKFVALIASAIFLNSSKGIRRSALQALSLDSLPLERNAEEKVAIDTILSRLQTVRGHTRSDPSEGVCSHLHSAYRIQG